MDPCIVLFISLLIILALKNKPKAVVPSPVVWVCLPWTLPRAASVPMGFLIHRSYAVAARVAARAPHLVVYRGTGVMVRSGGACFAAARFAAVRVDVGSN